MKNKILALGAMIFATTGLMQAMDVGEKARLKAQIEAWRKSQQAALDQAKGVPDRYHGLESAQQRAAVRVLINGESATNYEVPQDLTVKKLKGMIEASTDIPASDQRLFTYGGGRGRIKRELTDDENIYTLMQGDSELRLLGKQFGINVIRGKMGEPMLGDPSFALKIGDNTYPLDRGSMIYELIKKIEAATNKPLGQSTEVTIVITRPVK